MEFTTLQRHWERLGRRDPMWAVLTHPDKRDGGWDVEAFFASGLEEIGGVLARLPSLGLDMPRTRALDFGCGVGRLTQALAAQFDRADGVDISPAMVGEAERHNRRGNRCRYQVNAREDLGLFADGTFDFVYSAIVLQHMAPKYAIAYIREFVRVLVPAGVAVFQVPSHRIGVTASATAASSAVAGPLAADACLAELASPTAGFELPAHGRQAVAVSVMNVSSTAWPARASAAGRHQIAVANRWLTAAGDLVQRDDARVWLPHDVAPGQSIDLVIEVTAPAHEGDYLLVIDLVQEDVCWFAERGSAPCRIPCRVTHGQPGPPPILEPAPALLAPAGPPFRERHPVLYAVLKATRLRDVYWAARRGLDRLKLTRDEAIRTHVHPRANAARRWLDWHVHRRSSAVMEMHCVPRADVIAAVVGAGGRVIDVEEQLEAGGFCSCRYWVTKTPRS